MNFFGKWITSTRSISKISNEWTTEGTHGTNKNFSNNFLIKGFSNDYARLILFFLFLLATDGTQLWQHREWRTHAFWCPAGLDVSVVTCLREEVLTKFKRCFGNCHTPCEKTLPNLLHRMHAFLVFCVDTFVVDGVCGQQNWKWCWLLNSMTRFPDDFLIVK